MTTWSDVDAWAESQRKPKPAPAPKKTTAVFRAATLGEVAMMIALSKCSFSPGSFDKRFARDLAGQVDGATARITEKQAEVLRKLITRYRRQIKPGQLLPTERHLLTKEKSA